MRCLLCDIPFAMRAGNGSVSRYCASASDDDSFSLKEKELALVSFPGLGYPFDRMCFALLIPLECRRDGNMWNFEIWGRHGMGRRMDGWPSLSTGCNIRVALAGASVVCSGFVITKNDPHYVYPPPTAWHGRKNGRTQDLSRIETI